MQLILIFITLLLLGFLFWFVGHVITKFIDFNEEDKLLKALINISIGCVAYLLLVNLIATISSSFNIGLIVTFVLFVLVALLRFKELKEACLGFMRCCEGDNLSKLIKQNTDKYFWIFFGTLNLIYGMTAFATTKLERFGTGNNHIFHINQMLSDVFPPKNYFFSNLNIRYHFGADILGATLSKFTGVHPEISLDLLSLIFLNLSVLVIYALALKFFSQSSKITRYLVPFAAFLAWGPITSLFTKSVTETIPDKFLPRVSYLSQTRLTELADWSGLTLHWFFEPSNGFSILFFLIAIYLAFHLFNNKTNLFFSIVLGIFLGGLSVLDISKFGLIFIGVLLHLMIKYSQDEKAFLKDTTFLRNIGIVLGLSLLVGFVSGNCLRLDKDLGLISNLFVFGKSTTDPKFGVLKGNIILLLIYIFGFYCSYKEKDKWLTHIIPFFATGLLVPHLVTLPASGAQKLLMSANILGAFAIPSTLDFIKKKFDLREIKLRVFYTVTFILLSFSTLMFFAFGDKEKPNFVLDNVSFKFSGLQKISSSESRLKPQEDELPFIQYLKSKRVKNQAIVSEESYTDVFSSNTQLHHLAPPRNQEAVSLGEDILKELNNNYLSSFSLNTKFWVDKKIRWIYMTPKLFRYLMPPQARIRLLNAYLSKGVKLALSNGKSDDLTKLKELYEIDPHHLSSLPDLQSSKSIEELFGSNKGAIPLYIKQIAECPYFGIYSAMSNDFDGDKISDIAFFDQTNRTWIVISGKDQKEIKVDLASSLFTNYNGSDLFIPVPSDYDGDGKTDIALFNRTKGSWHILKSSDSSVLSNEHIRWGRSYGEFPMPADVDGDSKSDYSAFGNNHNWPTFLSTTSSYYDMSFPSGPLDIPLYSDIDNDKKADYILYRQDEGAFYVYLTSCQNEVKGEGCGLQKDKAIHVILGETSSRPVPSDYDGDGKIDLGTWTPKTGKWEITFAKDFLISGNNGTKHTLTLGKAGDIPMPGDYNGDGSSEIAVYDPNSTELEIYSRGEAIKKIDLTKYKNLTLASFIGV